MKLNMNFIKIVFSVMMIVSMSSCLDDDAAEVAYYYSTIGMVEKAEGDACYVATDTGKKLLVSNSQDMLSEVAEGDRVYAEFNLTGEKPQGYGRKATGCMPSSISRGRSLRAMMTRYGCIMSIRCL